MWGEKGFTLSWCRISCLCLRRYRDYDCGVSRRFDVLEFTDSIAAFKSFVSSVEARDGGDEPEDVAGGEH